MFRRLFNRGQRPPEPVLDADPAEDDLDLRAARDRAGGGDWAAARDVVAAAGGNWELRGRQHSPLPPPARCPARTETARLADAVLPAATRGQKQGQARWNKGRGVSRSRRPGIHRRMALIATLLVIWLVLAVLGLALKGLFWLFVIAVILFVVTGALGWFRRRSSRSV